MASASSPLAAISYTLGRVLYVSLTNRCNAVSLIKSRGPGFTISASSGFQMLPDGFEPSGAQIAAHISDLQSSGSFPEELCFAGAGEPLLRLRALEEAAVLIREQSPSLAMRINTNGLVPGSEADSVVTRLMRCGVRSATVALASTDAAQYRELMRPETLRYSPGFSLELGLDEVTGFISQCISAGIAVECTTVEAPGVDLDAASSLAADLGATFRSRKYFP